MIEGSALTPAYPRMPNRATHAPKCPSDVIALVVLWRLRCRLTLRDLAEMFLIDVEPGAEGG